MIDAIQGALVALAAAAGLGLVLLLGIWVWAKAQALPPATPPLPPQRERANEEALLALTPWRKRAPGNTNATAYQRPLDIASAPVGVPDDAVLPPPREVAGRNGET
jgi:hypothetical protein